MRLNCLHEKKKKERISFIRTECLHTAHFWIMWKERLARCELFSSLHKRIYFTFYCKTSDSCNVIKGTLKLKFGQQWPWSPRWYSCITERLHQIDVYQGFQFRWKWESKNAKTENTSNAQRNKRFRAFVVDWDDKQERRRKEWWRKKSCVLTIHKTESYRFPIPSNTSLNIIIYRQKYVEAQSFTQKTKMYQRF